jgi:hypothetical protein
LNVQEQQFFADPLHRQLAQMLKLQDEMNAMVNPAWRTAGYAWHRAIMVEGTELLEHFGQWKWWKKGDPDIYQAQLELVDIWHFALSWYLVRFGIEKTDDWVLVQAIARRIRAAQEKLPPKHYARLGTVEMVNGDIDRLVGQAAQGLFDHEPFVRLMDSFGLDFNLLHQMYIAKNGLNRFRQMYGYKQGAYLKNDWNGQEDNVVLERLLPEVVGQEDPMTALLQRLQEAYTGVCAAKPWYALPAPGGKFTVVLGEEHAGTEGAQRLPVRVA